MHRRQALKQITIATSGLIVLPAWMVSCGYSDTETHQSSFNSEHQAILASVTDTIIPAGSAVGALAVGTDKFIQKLIDDCHEKPMQDNVKKQLSALQQSASKQHKKDFAKCTQEQREKLLLNFADSSNKEEKDFFTFMKTETIRGYTTSQQVMEGLLGYKVAPGYYYGCVNMKA